MFLMASPFQGLAIGNDGLGKPRFTDYFYCPPSEGNYRQTTCGGFAEVRRFAGPKIGMWGAHLGTLRGRGSWIPWVQNRDLRPTDENLSRGLRSWGSRPSGIAGGFIGGKDLGCGLARLGGSDVASLAPPSRNPLL
jgi:hypothetical protein